MTELDQKVLTKVPEVTLIFWIIKISATTLGETGGDTVTMTWLHANHNAHNGGYLIGTGIFLTLLVVWSYLDDAWSGPVPTPLMTPSF